MKALALRQLVDPIDLEGRLVEMDALHTQDETVQKLLYVVRLELPDVLGKSGW